MTCKLYGISNCDTMKRAMKWLKQHELPFDFHDYKKSGIAKEQLVAWCAVVGWQALLNTRGTTWRTLTPAQQSDMNESRAVDLMQAYVSLIRRPVLVRGESILVGFDVQAYAALLHH